MSSAALFALPTVLSVIRCEAYRAWRSLRRHGYEPADLQQEFALRLLERHRSYDPKRASAATFSTHVCRHRALQLAERATTRKRGAGIVPVSFSEALTASGETEVTTVLADIVSDDGAAMRIGRRSRPAAELAEFRIDVNRVVAGLPPHLATFARNLASQTVTEAATSAGVGRATGYRYRAEIKAAFTKAGLDRYLVHCTTMGDAR
jgi:DNA-directed RNA polymerase specialized sigma24 family protein